MRHTVASVDRVPLTGRSLSKSGVVASAAPKPRQDYADADVYR